MQGLRQKLQGFAVLAVPPLCVQTGTDILETRAYLGFYSGGCNARVWPNAVVFLFTRLPVIEFDAVEVMLYFLQLQVYLFRQNLLVILYAKPSLDCLPHFALREG